MSGEQKQQVRPAADEAEVTPDPERLSDDAVTRAAEVSAKAASVVHNIDETLEEFDELMLSELFKPGEARDPAEVERRIKQKNLEFIQKGGQ